jgi:hypothetical protein
MFLKLILLKREIMNQNKSRRLFLKNSLFLAGGLVVPPLNFANTLNKNDMQDRPAPLSAELVSEFVRNAHGNFEKVKELSEKHPTLLNASWDWGNGDFETGMGAAGHTGRIQIAEYLLSKGARMDIFCAAMLGRIEIVKSILEFYPDLKNSKGPHGLALIHHAEQGGEKAKEVLAYLKEIKAS